MMRSMSLASVLTCGAIGFALPVPVAVAASGYTFTGGFESASGASTTTGFPFLVNEAISVTHLGVFDYAADGLSTARDVGLWTNSGTLLASITVPAGTGPDLLDQFRYGSITPVQLTAGEVYRVGAMMANEIYMSQVAYAPVSQITIVDAGYTFFGTSPTLTFPGPTFYSPATSIANFQFVIPEPTSLSVLGLGGVGLLRRRRQ